MSADEREIEYETAETDVYEKPSALETIYSWTQDIITAFIAAAVLTVFILKPVGVEGPSMMPTLHSSDWVVISNLFYEPQYKDIVVVSRNYNNDERLNVENGNEPVIKRVVATEGQEVDINFETGEVKVNGAVLQEEYINEPTNTQHDVQFPVVVPRGCIFVMGDNRNRSLDSRNSVIGMVDKRYVLGKAYLRVWRDKDERGENEGIFATLG